MAVGEKTNLEMSVDLMLTDLGTISRANGYWTDVKEKPFLPLWSPASDLVMARDAPSLQAWLMESGLSEEYSGVGVARYDCLFWIAGTIKNDREVQKKLWRFNEDVNGVMMWARTNGTWAFYVKHDGSRFFVEEGENSQGSGRLLTRWRVIVNTPSPNG